MNDKVNVQARAQEIAKRLMGTNDRLEDQLTEEEREDVVLSKQVVQFAVECVGCGVWVEPGETDEHDCCAECQAEYDEEDEEEHDEDEGDEE